MSKNRKTPFDAYVEARLESSAEFRQAYEETKAQLEKGYNMHQPEDDEKNQDLERLYAVVEIKNKKRQICLLETNAGTVAAVTASIKAANGLVVRFAADAGASKRKYILTEYVKVQDLMNVKNAFDKRLQPAESLVDAVENVLPETPKAMEKHWEDNKREYQIKDLFRWIEKYREDENAPHMSMQNIRFALMALLATTREEGYKEGRDDAKA